MALIMSSGSEEPSGRLTATSQTVFLIDLPRHDAASLADDPGPASSFKDDLVAFLGALTVDEKLVKSLDHYDFSQTASLRFVHSMYVGIPTNAVDAGLFLTNC